MIKKRKPVPAVSITAKERTELEKRTGRALEEESDAEVVAAHRRARVVEARDGTPQPNLKGEK